MTAPSGASLAMQAVPRISRSSETGRFFFSAFAISMLAYSPMP